MNEYEKRDGSVGVSHDVLIDQISVSLKGRAITVARLVKDAPVLEVDEAPTTEWDDLTANL